MMRNITCIICPRGCAMTAEITDTGVKVSGHTCPKGEEYAINENFGFMMRRYYDEDRNKWINKALTVVDGKVLNPKGIYIITKA